MATTIAGIDGGQVAVEDDALERLRAATGGTLLRPGDAGFDEAVLTWNGMVAQRPALVVQPTDPGEVAEGVRFAATHGALVSIKGGGHNIAGTAIAPGGLTLDMSRMRDVAVDAAARRVDVGPGCLLQDVDAATQEHDLATVLGFVSETGVAGLTLGGGFGYLSRRWGYTVDCLDEVEVVTATGDVLVANRAEHEDLFWAIRGGGGNFGVVTRFTFDLHEVGPAITGGLIAWSAEHAEDVLATYRAVTQSAPRTLTAALSIRLAPPAPFVPEEWHGEPIVAMILCHSGDTIDDDLAPLRDLPDPVADVVTVKSYAAQQSMLDATQPKGLHYYWKTEFLPGLSDEALDTFHTRALDVASPLSQSILFHIAGAVNEHGADDGAVGNRDAAYVGGFAGAWPADAPGDRHIAAVRAGWEALRPFSTGGNYVNFQLAEDGDGRTVDAYGPNYDRLARIKAAYDPDNLFRVNRNIQPAS